jgi:hypothetical protein
MSSREAFVYAKIQIFLFLRKWSIVIRYLEVVPGYSIICKALCEGRGGALGFFKVNCAGHNIVAFHRYHIRAYLAIKGTWIGLMENEKCGDHLIFLTAGGNVTVPHLPIWLSFVG